MFSGDHGQFPVPGSEYIPLIQGHRAHDIASWDNAMEQSSGKDTAPSLVSSTSIPPSTSGNILEENNAVPGNLLGRKNVLIEEERVSQALHSNWQVHTVTSGYIFLLYIHTPDFSAQR